MSAAQRHPLAMDARTARRAAAFVALSLALHALTLTFVTPRGAAPVGPAMGPVLHAVLASASARAERTAGSGEHDALSAGASAAAEGTRRQGPALPVPEKWYTASELSTLAQPLALPMFDYPAEMAPSAASARLRLRLFVDEGGAIRKFEFLPPRAPKAFEDAAIAGWEHVQFRPATKDGVAVKSQKLLELEFVPNRG